MGSASSTVPIADANFHECVDVQAAVQSGDCAFTFHAPDGEFTLFSYRIRWLLLVPEPWVLCLLTGCIQHAFPGSDRDPVQGR